MDINAGDPILHQDADFRYRVRFEGRTYGPWTVDEPPPLGGGAGPAPRDVLAVAVGHCMSTTLYDCLRRARIPVRAIETTVANEVGRNAAGRQRVVRLRVAIRADPVDEADRPRMDRCISVFEEYCTVSGAVRAGIPIDTSVNGAPTRA